jgi:hypothetical protein
MISSAFAHGATRVDITVRDNYVEVLTHTPDRSLPDTSFTIFGDSLARTRPTLSFDGVDVPALMSAAQQALRALREAHEGNPASLPLGVTEALDAIADVLEGR